MALPATGVSATDASVTEVVPIFFASWCEAVDGALPKGVQPQPRHSSPLMQDAQVCGRPQLRPTVVDAHRSSSVKTTSGRRARCASRARPRQRSTRQLWLEVEFEWLPPRPPHRTCRTRTAWSTVRRRIASWGTGSQTGAKPCFARQCPLPLLVRASAETRSALFLASRVRVMVVALAMLAALCINFFVVSRAPPAARWQRNSPRRRRIMTEPRVRGACGVEAEP
jgi:hypothetical protein